ncbi:hypothetical protein T03_11061 [Trichinella britovi]|uniref:Uncharacterized protein n=1 Tax=Trichinella britovi TaxID=45882 RepID=A0A0V1CWA3_TRIBR|nr:hypothetical protein T03_11061 [Trichinella britovi]
MPGASHLAATDPAVTAVVGGQEHFYFPEMYHNNERSFAIITGSSFIISRVIETALSKQCNAIMQMLQRSYFIDSFPKCRSSGLFV